MLDVSVISLMQLLLYVLQYPAPGYECNLQNQYTKQYVHNKFNAKSLALNRK